MYQVAAARSSVVWLYMPFHNIDVFVYACVRGGRRHRQTINSKQGAICHREQIILGGLLSRGTFCFSGFCPRWFLTWGLRASWFFVMGLFSVGF